MTALQWILKEAKSLKKQYPKRFTKWTDYVAQASAIYSSKHKGKSPVGKKKAAKKKAVKKTARKKVSGVKDSKELKKTLAKKGLKMPHGYATTKRKRIGSVKKKKISEQSILNKIHRVKDEVSKLDELQHKHMSGIHKVHLIHNKERLKKYNDLLNEIVKQEQYLLNWKYALKMNKGFPGNIMQIKKRISEIKKYISELKTHAKELKKHI